MFPARPHLTELHAGAPPQVPQSDAESPASTPVQPSSDGPGVSSGFGKYAWLVLIYTIGVILWGAFVRISFSGDGCGSHWPLCNGAVIPPDLTFKTFVEYSHRITSALCGFMVLGLAIWAFRAFPKRSHVRLAAVLALVFTATEALVGMALVRRELVAYNDSVERAIWMALHLVNSFLLIGFLTLAAVWATGIQRPRFRGQGAVGWALSVGLLGTLLLGVSGAVTALGDTLYPIRSSTEVIAASMSETAHFLVRLRVLHPLTAVCVGLLIVLIAGLVMHLRPDPKVRLAARWTLGLYGVQMLLGLVNVLMAAPVALQIAHLLVADAIWIALVSMSVAAVAHGVPQAEREARPYEGERLRGRALVGAYVTLTKPRVISLLLFTTLAAMFAAAGGWPGGWLLLAVAVGGYMSAGSANAMNMVVDRDIDGTMRRTASRPTVTQAIPTSHALAFAFLLGIGSFALLWGAANLMAAMLSLAGLVFYVIVYTMLLKRRTWHNIVIGGAAGAFPPLVGWSAVTGDLGTLAIIMFAIIFVWTPVHFWALALLIKDDYAKAGVPMLPVVRGERATVTQIGAYAVVTALVTLYPVAHGASGPLYFGFAIGLNIVLLALCMNLYRKVDRPRSLVLYKFSMLYLAILFAVAAVDQSMVSKASREAAGARVVSFANPMDAFPRRDSTTLSRALTSASGQALGSYEAVRGAREWVRASGRGPSLTSSSPTDVSGEVHAADL
jgi:heme o synthase